MKTFRVNREISYIEDTLSKPTLKKLKDLVTDWSQRGVRVGAPPTFWLPLDRAPFNTIERAIHELRAAAKISPRCKGAEWWVRICPADSEMGLHFDQDETLADSKGIVHSPVTASVFYLTDIGAPTTIYDRRAGEPTDIHAPAVATNIPPRINRYAVFRGNLMHGTKRIPAEIPNTLGLRTEPRIVLAVNWWDRQPTLGWCVDVPKHRSTDEFFAWSLTLKEPILQADSRYKS